MTSGRLRKGQMIIEAVIAFSVTMIALVAILELSNRSSANSGLSNRSAVATAYADEGINWVEQQRKDLSWNVFSGMVGQYCLETLDFSLLGACSASGNEIPGTIFTRNLTMTTGTKLATDGSLQAFVAAAVTITWPEGKRAETIQRQSEFFKNN